MSSSSSPSASHLWSLGAGADGKGSPSNPNMFELNEQTVTTVTGITGIPYKKVVPQQLTTGGSIMSILAFTILARTNMHLLVLQHYGWFGSRSLLVGCIKPVIKV